MKIIGLIQMSMKAAVKEHFSHHFLNNNISIRFKSHIDYIHGINYIKSINENENLLLRKFTIEDVDKCTELFKEVFSDYPWYDKWVSVNQAKIYLTELIVNPVFEGFVAYKSSNIVAVCFGHKRSWWTGKEFVIDEFYVAKDMQGNGIGTELMNFVKNSFISENYTRLVLLTNKDIPAEEFYAKNGFRINEHRISMIKEF